MDKIEGFLPNLVEIPADSVEFKPNCPLIIPFLWGRRSCRKQLPFQLRELHLKRGNDPLVIVILDWFVNYVVLHISTLYHAQPRWKIDGVRKSLWNTEVTPLSARWDV